jgi:trehalose-6-phosphate synthase
MAPEERRARMTRMRTYVREHNIYRWAGTLIAELAAIRISTVEERPFVRPMRTELASMSVTLQ